MIKYCRKCLTLETENNYLFNDKVCSACKSYEGRKLINWKFREKEFKKIFKIKRNNFDCIIPVSGGKDSTYQICKALQFGLKPLGVFVDTGHLPLIGKKNFENLKDFDVPLIHLSFEKKIFDKLAEIGLRKTGDIEWIEALAVNISVLNIAIKFKVNSILWGENPQEEYGGPKKFQKSKIMIHKEWFQKYGLTYDFSIQDIIDKYKINRPSFNLLKYPHLDDLKKIKAYFLGYFFNWDSFENFKFAKKKGFLSFNKRIPGAILKYENIDNYHAGIHDYFRYLKTGMGRAHDQVSRLIRRNKLKIKEGIKLIEKFDGEFPYSYTNVKIETILKELNMSKKEFCDLSLNYLNNKYFYKPSKLKFGEVPKKKDFYSDLKKL